jgi:hypothetical protein
LSLIAQQRAVHGRNDMAIKKRWLEAAEEAAAQETVRLPWARGMRRMTAAALARQGDDSPAAAPA